MEEQRDETQMAPVVPEPDPTPPNRRSERDRNLGGIVWATVLIGAGVVFLLNNMGVLGWGVWFDILRFWPVLLIAAGVSIVFGRRSVVGAAISAALILGAISAAIWLYPANYTYASSAGEAELIREEITQPLEGASRADVEIQSGVCDLRIGALAVGDLLVDGSVSRWEGEQISRSFQVDGGTARFRLCSASTPEVWLPGDWWDGRSFSRSWDLRLNRDVPTSLTVEAGVGRSEIDLSQTLVTRVDLKTGVGDTTLILPESGKMEVDVKRGVGRVVIKVPESMAARIVIEGGLGSTQVAEDFVRQGEDNYVSPDYSTATNQADIQVDGGVGDVTIERYQGRQ